MVVGELEVADATVVGVLEKERLAVSAILVMESDLILSSAVMRG